MVVIRKGNGPSQGGRHREAFFVGNHMTARKQSLQFHVKSDDYFATLATILSVIKEQLQESPDSATECCETLSKLKEDLLYLKDHYTIVKKEKKNR